MGLWPERPRILRVKEKSCKLEAGSWKLEASVQERSGSLRLFFQLQASGYKLLSLELRHPATGEHAAHTAHHLGHAALAGDLFHHLLHLLVLLDQTPDILHLGA